ncbi:transporter [Peterkaempfera bronchialis]|uniref:transporter n=1 Tax=Peterkaempfera bronchialis TaxID=2126346 RepID=UPI003C2AEAC8
MTSPTATADRDVVRALVSLKLRLLRNGLRRSGGRAAVYAIGSLVGLAMAAGLAVALGALHGHRGAADAAVVLAAGLTVAWAALPLFLFSSDESADPTRLTMLPLRPAPLLRGMLLAALVGPGPLVSLVLLSGAGVAATSGAGASGASGASGSAVVAVVAVPLAALTLVVLCRAVAAGNARLLSSRRGRDFAILGGLLFAFLIQGANLLVQSTFGSVGPDGGIDLSGLAPAAAVLRWIPPVSAVGAVHSTADGAYAVAAVQLLAAAGLLAVLLRWWLTSLVRLMVTADSSTLAAAPSAERRSGKGPGRLARLLPEGRVGAVVQRQLRYVWREPRAKVAVFSGVGMTLVVCVLSAVQGWASVYVVLVGGLLLGWQTLNLFGMDGSAFWMVATTVGTRSDARAELRGRSLAVAGYAVPFTALLGLAAAAAGGGWADLPEAVGLSWGVLGTGIGVGLVLSVLVPYAMPADGSPMQNAAPGQSALVMGNMLGSMVGVLALCVPLGVLALVLHLADGPTWVMLAVGPLYGLGMAVLGIRFAARRMVDRLPEILVSVIER